MLTYFFAYLLCGCIVGFCAGLLGIGGGVIGIPLLFLLFNLQGISASISMHMAVGTLFATVVLTSISSILSHYRSGMILLPVFKKIIGGTMLGCVLGVVIASHLTGIYLQRIFGLFLWFLALQYFFNKNISVHDTFPSKRKIFFATTSIGTLSGLLGLGGGIFIVPYLNWYGVSMRNAIATSSACILPVAIIGATGYIYAGMHIENGLPFSSGFVDWLAFLGIGITSVLFAPLGARVTHTISPILLRRFFSFFLVFVGLSMIVQSV
jgi:uncharacterized membrane protein YfcA